MRRTNKIILMTLMISLLLLGIGYAAIQNITLSISGYAEVGAKADNFNVRFLEQVDITKNGFDNVIVDAQKTSDVTATINLSGLSKAGETITAIYTVKNESPDLSADLTISTSNDAPEYLTISSQLDKTSILAGEEAAVEVIVEVTKTPISENIRAQIGVELIAMPVQPGEEGSSEGIKDFDQTPESDGRNEYGYYYDRFYSNEEVGIGIISYSDYSVEIFQFITTEENSNLEKDDWICIEHLSLDVEEFETEILNSIRVENNGKTIINEVENIEFSLTDIVPGKIYMNQKYTAINEDGEIVSWVFLENGMMIYSTYDAEGNLLSEISIDNYLRCKPNAHMVGIYTEPFGLFNLSGDLFFNTTNEENGVFKIEKAHDYEMQIIKEPNCIDYGTVECICNDCEDIYTMSIRPYNHKFDQNYDYVCDKCGEMFQCTTGISVATKGILYILESNIEDREIFIPSHVFEELFSVWTIVKEIDSYSFSEYKNLNTITLPNTITKIEYGAFEGCDSLQTVNYAGTQEEWEAIEIAEGNDILNNVIINFNYVIPTE